MVAQDVSRGRLFPRDTRLLLATVLLGGLVLSALVGPVLWTLDPSATDLSQALQPPGGGHPFGTDASGRDLLARFLQGARISLLVGVAVVLTSGLVGGLLGLLAGLSRGVIDPTVMRVMDMILAFPSLILAMTVAVGLGAGITSAAIGAALTCVPVYARLLRTDIVRVIRLPHIEAARSLGIRRAWIVVRHVLPHTVPTMLVQSAAVFGSAILTLAALGFVGLGAQIPTPEWGAMITDGMGYALTGGWWVALFPGLGLFAAVCGANLLGDALEAWLDPRSETRRQR